MNLLRNTLLGVLCLAFAAGVRAQEKPAETMEVKGKIGKEMVAKWKPGEILVLKNGAAVRAAWDALKRPTDDTKKAASGVEDFNDPKKKPPGIKNDKDFAKGKEKAQKKYNEKLAVYEESLKKFNAVLKENTVSKITYEEDYTFTATVPERSSLYFSISQGSRGYIWIEKSAKNVQFEMGKWLRDLTFTPKPEPAKK